MNCTLGTIPFVTRLCDVTGPTLDMSGLLSVDKNNSPRCRAVHGFLLVVAHELHKNLINGPACKEQRKLRSLDLNGETFVHQDPISKQLSHTPAEVLLSF